MSSLWKASPTLHMSSMHRTRYTIKPPASPLGGFVVGGELSKESFFESLHPTLQLQHLLAQLHETPSIRRRKNATMRLGQLEQLRLVERVPQNVRGIDIRGDKEAA